MKALLYTFILVLGGAVGLFFAGLMAYDERGKAPNPQVYLPTAAISVPVGVVLGGACAAFVAWLSKE